MRTVTETNTFNVYKYSELSSKAKDKVRDWLIQDDTRNYCFKEDCIFELQEKFPNSDLKVQYSLSYCQGDGLNIYGTLEFKDFMKYFTCSDKERKALEFYFRYQQRCSLSKNTSRYSYSVKDRDRDRILWELVDELEYYKFRDINQELIQRLANAICDYFEKLESDMESDGYSYLYYEEDGDIEETCEINDYEFLESGKVYR